MNQKLKSREFYAKELAKISRIIRLAFVLIVLGTNSILAVASPEGQSQQQKAKKVSGKVIDSTGGGLPGVSVVVKGTMNGVITDMEGNFAIANTPDNSVLVFSFVGMKSQEITVGGKSTINITLADETVGIEEVVAIGYGTQKRGNLTGSVSSVQGKELSAYPVTNAAQALQGKIAGVTITSVDGRPDAKVSIRVRGGGSITQSNDPLFIVDGFPVSSINDIPSSQIESINILKDASSTAIYGARGANGVIIVTTKTPKGETLSITYDGNVQIKTPSKYLGVLNPYDFTLINWEFGTLFGYGDAWEMAYGLGAKYSNLNAGGINSYKTAASRDIQREAIGTSYSQTHNLTVNGGNAKTKYTVSIDNLNDDGIKIQSWYKRTNILAKLRQEITKNLFLDLDAHLSDQHLFGNEDQTSTVGSKLTNAMRYTPVTPLGDVSGDNSQIGMYDNYVRKAFDPIAVMNDIYDKTNTQIIRGNAALSWKVLDGLTLRSEYGVSQVYSSRYYFNGPVSKNTVGVEGGDASVAKGNVKSYRFVNTANYIVKGLSAKHRLDLLAGQEINGSDGEKTLLSGTRYPISFDYKKTFAMMNQYGNQTEVVISNSLSEPVRLSSFFGRVNYALKDRYLFTATLRADGSSNFATAHRWGYFPAAAAAWRISEEPFIKKFTSINNLKLRLSYGEAGNDQISSGLWKMEWAAAANGYSYSNIGNSYYVPSSQLMTNPNLKWETTVTRNAGLDYGLFNNRIYGTIDAYWNTTKNLLMVNQIPAYTGYTSQMANVGQTRNIGLEFSLGGDIVRKKDLNVSANFNVSFNRNKIEALSDEMAYYYYTSNWSSSSTRPSGGDFAFMVGKSVGLIRGFVQDGFYTTADFNYNATTKVYTLKPGLTNTSTMLGVVPGVGSAAYPGMLKLKKLGTTNSATDINEADDATIIGNTNPKHTGGFNVNATYKKFDLLVGFNWSYGNQIFNANKLANSYGLKLPFRNFSDVSADWYHLFKVDASGNLARVYDPAELDAMNVDTKTYYPFHENGVTHSGGIEDGSFLRLNNVTLGYSLPSDLSKRIAIQKLRVYATISNAWLWTKYTGYDPEIDAGNGRNNTYPTPGMDFGAYPRARTFTFGVNVSF